MPRPSTPPEAPDAPPGATPTIDYRALFERGPAAYLAVARDAPRWTVIAVSDTYLAITHTAREELVGHGLFDRFPESDETRAEEGRRNIAASFARVLASRAPDVLPVQRYDLPRPDAPGGYEEKYWELSSLPVADADGRVAAILYHVQDVTARVLTEDARREAVAMARTAEQRLSAVFRQAPVGVAVMVGPEHVFETVNEAYVTVVGDRPLTGKTIREAFPELGSQGVFDILDTVYRTGTPFVASEYPLSLTRDGVSREAYYSFVYQPLLADGAVIGIVVVVTDVTELVVARKTAEAARAAAEEANRARSAFLATMSHELRTPRNAIGGYAELIALGVRGPVTPEQRADLERIQRSQQHLLGLINDVLNFVKLDAGHVRYEVEDVPLRAVFERVAEVIEPQSNARGLRLAVVPPGADVRARADEEKVRQVLLNLLSNAVKFTDAGGEVRVSAAVDGETVAVAVRDTGTGIAADQLDVIFDPFVQVGRGLSSPAQGVGLGLAISRDLARGMSGDLTVESRLGEGSTFTLTLPRAERARAT